MGWNGSGTVNRINGTFEGSTVWAQDRAAGTKITAGNHDSHDQDLADAIENCVARDGQNSPSANLPMATNRHTGVGAAQARTDYARYDQLQDGVAFWAGVSTGSANAQELTLTPSISAYATGATYIFEAGYTNTGAATLDVNSVGAQSIVTPSIGALIGGEIVAGQIYLVVYEPTNSDWVLINPSTAYNTWTPTLGASGSMTYGSTTVSYARYTQVGDKVDFEIKVTGTTGGSADDSLTFTLPVTPANDDKNFSALVDDGVSATDVGFAFWDAGGSAVNVRKVSSANWGTGSGRAFIVSGTYEAS